MGGTEITSRGPNLASKPMGSSNAGTTSSRITTKRLPSNGPQTHTIPQPPQVSEQTKAIQKAVQDLKQENSALRGELSGSMRAPQAGASNVQLDGSMRVPTQPSGGSPQNMFPQRVATGLRPGGISNSISGSVGASSLAGSMTGSVSASHGGTVLPTASKAAGVSPRAAAQGSASGGLVRNSLASSGLQPQQQTSQQRPGAAPAPATMVAAGGFIQQTRGVPQMGSWRRA